MTFTIMSYPSEKVEQFDLTPIHYAVINLSSKKQSSVSKMARLSGLQKEVLVLYRSCLREARKKPEVSPPLALLLGSWRG